MERLQVAAAAGTVPEGAGEEGVPVQAAELADASAIEADRAVPHDLLEGGGLLDALRFRGGVARDSGIDDEAAVLLPYSRNTRAIVGA